MLRETRLKETEWDYLLLLVHANINQTPVATLAQVKSMPTCQKQDSTRSSGIARICKLQ
ncbi:hypothetical protein H310_00931 [Aphanomyces invadans]|uniref:Uncharacterized protein n=1 Tax=Aphanomyces invadans TaxID=157072 RepID=A0A024UPF1_9STRA|nr:hypothetical protein H310_00931 [Aphanomyces invadans]ETW08321.1 hypothetical protein H310_00931 [Aphanomyces invadans]|eukprot:XP_008862126.1 hypothetical protein H310_00931 [Aphanomyces invadans]